MTSLENFHQLGKDLTEKLRLQTFPLAIRMVKSAKDFPEKARRPSVFDMKITMCQGYTFSRRIGWTMGLTREDMKCTPNLIAYGFVELDDPKGFIEAFRAMDYYETDVAAANMMKHFPLLKPGEYEGVVVSPLGWTKIIPDVVLVFGNSAQIMRLVHAALYKTGDPIQSINTGLVASCLSGVLQTFLTGKPNIVIPGAGDRVFAATQDHEIIFSIPKEMLEDTVDSLTKAGFSHGIRYPLPIPLSEPSMVPEVWTILEKRLKSSKE